MTKPDWADAESLALGVETDAAIAARVGVARSEVTGWRVACGLRSPKGGRPRGGSRLEKYRHLFGVLPDADVARWAKVNMSTVWLYRSTRPDLPAPALTRPRHVLEAAPGPVPSPMRVNLRLTPEEFALLDAARGGRPMTAWVRSVVVGVAKSLVGEE